VLLHVQRPAAENGSGVRWTAVKSWRN
jgi:hypothetical protein